MQKPTLGKINFLLQPKFDTYPLPRPGTYPRGAGTPIKDFFFLFNKDIFSNNRVFDFQYGGHSLVIVTFRKTATDQYKPRVTLALPTESMGRSGWKCSRGQKQKIYKQQQQHKHKTGQCEVPATIQTPQR